MSSEARGTVKDFERWLATRPECVQKLAREFPPGSIVRDGSHPDWFLLGWNEDDKLIVSETDPVVDYGKAISTKKYVCAQHIRDHLKEVKDRE